MKKARKMLALVAALLMAFSCLCSPAALAMGFGASTLYQIPGTHTYEDMTLVLVGDNTAGTYTLTANGAETSGSYTVELVVGEFNMQTEKVYLDEAGRDVLAATLPWYWGGAVKMDSDTTFAPVIEIADAQVDFELSFEKSAESPTGYYTTITVKDDGYESVSAYGGWDYYKMDLITPPEGVPYAYSTDTYGPTEWESDMYYGLGSLLELEKQGDEWVLTLALPSGFIGIACYHDLTAEEIGTPHLGDDSKVVIPYDAEKQPFGFDWSVADVCDKAGTVDRDVVATTADGKELQLSVYTPYGYDANREEPYPVVYLIPGGGTTYVTWFDGGVANRIFDNLIAQGVVKPCLVVSMDMGSASGNLVPDIIPYMEANYNVSTEAADRAVMGTSMGSVACTSIWENYPEEFCAFAFGSGALKSFDEVDVQGVTDEQLEAMKQPGILIGGGTVDFNMFAGDANSASIYNLNTWMNNFGVEHNVGLEDEYMLVCGGHGWDTWTPMLITFAENYLWEGEEPVEEQPGDASAVEPVSSGVQVSNSGNGANPVVIAVVVVAIVIVVAAVVVVRRKKQQ